MESRLTTRLVDDQTVIKVEDTAESSERFSRRSKEEFKKRGVQVRTTRENQERRTEVNGREIKGIV